MKAHDPQTDFNSSGRSPTWGHRAFRASFQMLAVRITTRFIGFARNIIIARILAPADVGLFGLVLVVLSMMDRFSATGMTSAVVQKPNSTKADLDTVWTVQALRGIIQGTLIVLAAEPLAVLLGVREAASAVQVLGVVELLRGFTNVSMIELRRALEVEKQFKISALSLSTDLVVSIIASVALRNAWGLLLGLVAGKLATLVASYVIHPYRPQIRYNHEVAMALSRFGRWLFLNNVLMFLALQGDRLIIGRFLGIQALGAYMLALTLSGGLAAEIRHVYYDIVFPAVSRVQDDRAKVRRGYLRMAAYTIMATLPFACVIAFLPRQLTLLLLGPKWLEVAAVLPALAFAASIRSIAANASWVYNGLGRPDLSLRQTLIGVVFTYGGMAVAIHGWGLRGVSIAVLLGSIATLPSVVYNLRRLLSISARDVLEAVYPGLLLSAAVGAAISLRLRFGPIQTDGALPVSGLLVAAAGAYALGSLFLWASSRRGPIELIQSGMRGLNPTRI